LVIKFEGTIHLERTKQESSKIDLLEPPMLCMATKVIIGKREE
jgi:hypothetical protein